MKIFLTGATGYLGGVIAEKLLRAGHRVVGLARSGTGIVLRPPNVYGRGDGQAVVLAVEKAPGGDLFHAGAQAGWRTRDIAGALSHDMGMGLGGRTVALEGPVLADALGLAAMAGYWASNSQSSGDKTRRMLGWTPEHLDLLGEVAR
ncbi:NAD-dependent epimerase/dehydratase family protein [Amycolatopsis sp. cmx-4-61]|uniref:NAD-dependent epimerase/dehydratase family protein n=1 Tax=Amycolatopsis sp. cmx-4-61 TaxID=2790937 RepID=UPI00397DA785